MLKKDAFSAKTDTFRLNALHNPAKVHNYP